MCFRSTILLPTCPTKITFLALSLVLQHGSPKEEGSIIHLPCFNPSFIPVCLILHQPSPVGCKPNHRLLPPHNSIRPTSTPQNPPPSITNSFPLLQCTNNYGAVQEARRYPCLAHPTHPASLHLRRQFACHGQPADGRTSRCSTVWGHSHLVEVCQWPREPFPEFQSSPGRLEACERWYPSRLSGMWILHTLATTVRSDYRADKMFSAVKVFGPPIAEHPTGQLPQHGFARTSRWEYLGKTSSESSSLPNSKGDASVKLDFGLSNSMLPNRKWDYDFNLTYSVTLSQDSLETSLAVRNTGSSNYDFQILFHSYLAVNVSC